MTIWLCQLSGRYLVMFEFYLNQDFIAKNLCINRDKPQMQCNGKCHLKKQLTAEERKEQENPERRTDNKSEIFYANADLINNITPTVSTVSIHYYNPASIGTPIDRVSTIFHPPGV